MAQVFISHATEDAIAAREVADAFRAAQLGIWIAPDSILPGQAYNEAIVAGLKSSDALAVLVSRAANASKHVAREVALADDQGKRIVPIRIEPVEPSDGLTYYLNLPQWVEWHVQGAPALAPVIALLNGRPAPPPMPPPIPPRPQPQPHEPRGAATAVIQIQRAKALGASLRKFAILVDGEKVGEIGNGEVLNLQVAPGRRELVARMDHIKSEPFAVDVVLGRTSAVQVSAAETANLSGQLAGLLGRSGYFKWVRLS